MPNVFMGRGRAAAMVMPLLCMFASPSSARDPDGVAIKPVRCFRCADNDPDAQAKWETNADKVCALDPPKRPEVPPAYQLYTDCPQSALDVFAAIKEVRGYEAGGLHPDQNEVAGAEHNLDACLAKVAATALTDSPIDAVIMCKPLDEGLANARKMLANANPPLSEDTPLNSFKVNSPSWRLLFTVALYKEADEACTSRARRVADDMDARRAGAAPTRPVAELVRVPRDSRLPEEQKRIDDAIAACRKDTNARLEDRREHALSRPIDELRAIPERYRLPEEQKRIDDDDAQHAALVNAHRHDRAWAGPVLSAAVCFASATKTAAVDEIRKEKSYAQQYGGVVDAQKLYALQQRIRDMDEAQHAAGAAMSKLKASQQSCSAVLIKQLVACLPFGGYQNASQDEACATPQIRGFVEIADVAPFAE